MTDVALALVERDGALLFLRRDRDPMVGFWELPGGKVEAGETPAEAAVRELAEEAGLVGTHARPAGRFVHDYPWGTVALHAIRVEAEGQPGAGAFLPPERWADPDVLPGTRLLLAALFPSRD